MSPSELSKKLGLRSGEQVLRLANAPEGFAGRLGELPEGVTLTNAMDGAVDGLLLFIHDQAEFHALNAAALAGLKYDGLCWLAYPKKSAHTPSDLSREVVWQLMAAGGWKAVAQVSVDEVWSALRFRPAEQVQRKG